MPRYFFDYFDSGERGKTSDNEGTDLDGPDAALHEAREALAEYALDVVPGDGFERTLRITVRDEDGTTILECSMTFKAHLKRRKP